MSPPLLWALWLINGLLAILYTLLDNVLLLLLLPPLLWLILSAPEEHRPWITASSILAILTAAIVPPPIPIILTLMAWAGAGVARLDRFNPTALRWRANGGIALYAAAALAFTAYSAYSRTLDIRSWTGIMEAAEAGAVITQGKAFLNVIAVWGLWIIMPLGYFGLILQGLFVHPPMASSPENLIHLVRSRGVGDR